MVGWRAIQPVQDHVRVMRVALQDRWKVDVGQALGYGVRRIGSMANPPNWGPVWDHGVFLGVKGKTGEIVIGARSGIFKARTVRRRSTEDRWNPKAMELVTGAPWRTSEDDDKVDGEKFAKLQVPEEATRKQDEDVKKEREMAHESMPRSFFIKKKDMEQHGHSAKCPGCASVIRGTTRQAHSAACRMRFGEILKSTEKYKRVEEKFDQHVARALERQDEENRKRRKVEQEKTEAAGTLDARESELMEETREKRPAEGEVERDNKRSRPGELEETHEKSRQKKRLSGTTSDHGLENDETSAWKWMAWTAKRSRKTNCTSRAWRLTPMKTSAVRKSVTRSSKKSFTTSTWIPSWSRRRGRKRSSSITECLEITARPPISVAKCPMQARSTGFQA